MEFFLSLLNNKKLLNITSKKIILYADFNVLNFLYESKINFGKEVTLYPDSTLVTWCLNLLNKEKIKKIVSTDLQQELLNEFVKSKKRLFFFGDTNDTLQRMSDKLLTKYGEISILGLQNGYYFNNEEFIGKLNSINIDVLFVGLGLSRQEKWIHENYSKINSKLIISVGGWFQYLAAKKNRASLFMRNLHLEWLHKLFIEFPRIWKRYFIGAPIFIFRIITKKIILKLDSEIK